jgi:hypothetical protein
VILEGVSCEQIFCFSNLFVDEISLCDYFVWLLSRVSWTLSSRSQQKTVLCYGCHYRLLDLYYFLRLRL